ncbi:MAG: hypothetical protein ACOVOX_09030, partial [Burkholderiaceae bacterium]
MIPFRTLRLQLRFLLPLGLTLIAASYMAVPLMDQMTLRWFSRDLNSRGALVANALSDSIADALREDRTLRLRPLFGRAAQDERLFALGLCSTDGRRLEATERFPDSLSCPQAIEVAHQAEPRLPLAGGAVHVGVQDILGLQHPPTTSSVVIDEPAAARRAAMAEAARLSALLQDDSTSPKGVVAKLVLLHDLSFIERRSQDTRRYLIGLIAALGLVIALTTVVVAQL